MDHTGEKLILILYIQFYFALVIYLEWWLKLIVPSHVFERVQLHNYAENANYTGEFHLHRKVVIVYIVRRLTLVSM